MGSRWAKTVIGGGVAVAVGFATFVVRDQPHSNTSGYAVSAIASRNEGLAWQRQTNDLRELVPSTRLQYPDGRREAIIDVVALGHITEVTAAQSYVNGPDGHAR